MYKLAASILENNPDVQEALSLLKSYHFQSGTKARPPHERNVGRKLNLSPIPAFEKMEGTPPEDISAAVDLLKEAMNKVIQMGIDSGEMDASNGRKYQKITSTIQDPTELLDWYHTFVARIDPETQQGYLEETKTKRKRETYEGRLKSETTNSKILGIFSSLDDEDAVDFAKFYLSHRWKNSDEVVRFGERMLKSYETTSKSAKCILKIRQAQRGISSMKHKEIGKEPNIAKALEFINRVAGDVLDFKKKTDEQKNINPQQQQKNREEDIKDRNDATLKKMRKLPTTEGDDFGPSEENSNYKQLAQNYSSEINRIHVELLKLITDESKKNRAERLIVDIAHAGMNFGYAQCQAHDQGIVTEDIYDLQDR